MQLESDVEKIVQRTVEHFKRLDVLIPNAGVIVRGPLETVSMEDYDRVMEINVRSIVLLMKLCSPYLIESKGNVVSVSSVNGLRAVISK